MDFRCESVSHAVAGQFTSPAPQGLNPCECGSHGGEHPEISSKFGWGGPRSNSGGARANSGGARPGAGRKPRAAWVREQLVASVTAARRPTISGVRWYCFRAYRGMEPVALAELLAQQFDALIPQHEKELPDHTMVRRPLFPGYGFVRFDREADNWRPIASTRGIKRLFGTSPELPTPVPFGIVETMIAGIDGEGVVKRDMIPPPEPIEIEAPYRVLAGPLEDLRGVARWSDGDRVKLAHRLFGRDLEIELPRSLVERVDT